MIIVRLSEEEALAARRAAWIVAVVAAAGRLSELDETAADAIDPTDLATVIEILDVALLEEHDATLCVHCERERKVYRSGLCRACAQYQRRTGHLPPEVVLFARDRRNRGPDLFEVGERLDIDLAECTPSARSALTR